MSTQKEKQVFDLIKEKFPDPERRKFSGNIYKIKDKAGNISKFVPNENQMILNREYHTFNVILKARQLWFTTDIDVLHVLDRAICKKNQRCWIIADTLPNASAIMQEKIILPYENMPEIIKQSVQVKKQNESQFHFTNGSQIEVSTNFRSWTLQVLHVSELWPIARKSSKKAKEIMDWAFTAIWEWGICFIESTAEGRVGEFWELCQLAQRLKKEGKKLNHKEPKFFFFAWWENPKYSLYDPDLVLTDETIEYFKFLRKDHWIIVSREQWAWYQAEKQIKKSSMKKENPSYPEEAFGNTIGWTYFSQEIELLYKEERCCYCPYDPALKTYLVMDLWTANFDFCFFQKHWKEIRVIKWIRTSNISIVSLHSNIIEPLKRRIERVFLPHDWTVREMKDHKTREQIFQDLGYQTKILDRNHIGNRIDIAKETFRYCFFDKKWILCSINDTTYSMLDMLAVYQEDIDEASWIFLWKPARNIWVHTWDDFCYLAEANLILEEENSVSNYAKDSEVIWRDFSDEL